MAVALTGDPEDPYGCAYINKYCANLQGGFAECLHTEEKGRILVCARDYKVGDILFEEPPLHIVAEKKENTLSTKLDELAAEAGLDYEALWYWCALNSLTEDDLKGCTVNREEVINAEGGIVPVIPDKQYKLLLLYHGEITEASEDIHKIIEHLGLDPNSESPELAIKMERLLQVWILNCFEHSESPLGYSTYFMSSFMSHSCFPNVVWHYHNEDLFVLRARRDIKKGDEICCSYLSEDALFESAMSRKACLEESKHFVCTCERCSTGLDRSRGFLCPYCKMGTVFPSVVDEKRKKPYDHLFIKA